MGSVQERANRILATGAPIALTTLAAVFATFTLSACSTPQERAAQKQAEVEQMMVVYGPACQRLGYQPNSDTWRNCVLQLKAQDDQQHYQMSSGYCGGWGPGYWRDRCW